VARTARAKYVCKAWLHQSRISCGDYRSCHHCADEHLDLPCVVHVRLPSVDSHGCYCSSSPASVNALLALDTDAPQTTLVAVVLVPVLAPQTTLKALSVLSFQGSEQPQTTDVPLQPNFPKQRSSPDHRRSPNHGGRTNGRVSFHQRNRTGQRVVRLRRAKVPIQSWPGPGLCWQ